MILFISQEVKKKSSKPHRREAGSSGGTRAINDAGIEHKDVALVLAKTPLLTREMAVVLPCSTQLLIHRSSMNLSEADS
jgi:hypothetical protein